MTTDKADKDSVEADEVANGDASSAIREMRSTLTARKRAVTEAEEIIRHAEQASRELQDEARARADEIIAEAKAEAARLVDESRADAEAVQREAADTRARAEEARQQVEERTRQTLGHLETLAAHLRSSLDQASDANPGDDVAESPETADEDPSEKGAGRRRPFRIRH